MQNANTVNEDRRLWKLLVFGILTLGIYAIVFMVRLVKDLNIVCGRQESDETQRSPHYVVVLLLSMITFSIYGWYWYYKQGNRMQQAADRYGFRIKEGGGTYLFWIILGPLVLFGQIYGIYLFLMNVNKLARAYNYQITHQLDEGGKTTLHGVYDGEPPAGDFWGREDDPPAQPVRTPPSFVYPEGPPTVSKAIGTLEGIRGQYAGMKMTVSPGDDLVIGRGGQYSQLIVTDMDISRKHCTVRFSATDASFYVTDHSTYGTYLNGTIRLEKEVSTKVPIGSRISLGNGNNEFLLH